MKGKRINRNKYRARKNRKSAIILVVTFFILCVVVLAVKFIPKKDKFNVQVGTNQEQDKNDFEDKDVTNDTEDKVTNILDNSNYLELKDDPNADDAAMVAENTKGLLNGTKTYPVRTDGKKIVYLTFDDGPSTTNTPAVLEVLDKYNVKGTFFVLGKSLEGNEEAQNVLKDIAKGGHAIANHTYGHDYSYLYPNRTMNVDNIVSDIERNNNLMKEILGKDFTTRVLDSQVDIGHGKDVHL
ncbi:MAG: polysaccharide deacetylase family protein [Clostridium celatum]|nr:polysaccharide deacetylase family protein [Clostridium celatum]